MFLPKYFLKLLPLLKKCFSWLKDSKYATNGVFLVRFEEDRLVELEHGNFNEVIEYARITEFQILLMPPNQSMRLCKQNWTAKQNVQHRHLHEMQKYPFIIDATKSIHSYLKPDGSSPSSDLESLSNQKKSTSENQSKNYSKYISLLNTGIILT